MIQFLKILLFLEISWVSLAQAQGIPLTTKDAPTQINSRNVKFDKTKVLRPKTQTTVVPSNSSAARVPYNRNKVLKKPTNYNPYNSRKQSLPTKQVIPPAS